MALRHPALQIAEDTDVVVKLRAAAPIAGAPDPYHSLRYVDCDPPALRHLSGNMNNARSPIKAANYELVQGIEIASENWEGDAKGAFLAEAAQVLREHLAAQKSTDQTAAIGQRLEPGLDNIANSAASGTISIAQEVEDACDEVLSGDYNPEAIEAVHRACGDIVEMTSRLASQISDIGTGLADLAQPARR